MIIIRGTKWMSCGLSLGIYMSNKNRGEHFDQKHLPMLMVVYSNNKRIWSCSSPFDLF